MIIVYARPQNSNVGAIPQPPVSGAPSPGLAALPAVAPAPSDARPAASVDGARAEIGQAPNLIEGWGPPPIALHGPRHRSLSPQEKSDLIRLHENLGHPSPEQLASHLRASGAAEPDVSTLCATAVWNPRPYDITALPSLGTPLTLILGLALMDGSGLGAKDFKHMLCAALMRPQPFKRLAVQRTVLAERS